LSVLLWADKEHCTLLNKQGVFLKLGLSWLLNLKNTFVYDVKGISMTWCKKRIAYLWKKSLHQTSEQDNFIINLLGHRPNLLEVMVCLNLCSITLSSKASQCDWEPNHISFIPEPAYPTFLYTKNYNCYILTGNVKHE
jgi:hypothetical protein